MSVALKRLEVLEVAVDEVYDLVKGEQRMKRFGTEGDDALVKYITAVAKQQKTTLDNFRSRLEVDFIPSSSWSRLCGLIPITIFRKSGSERSEFLFVEERLSKAKEEATTASRLRRQNFTVAVLAFYGIFQRSDEDDSIAVSYDMSCVTSKKYALSASSCTRETLQERSERMRALSVLVMSNLGYQFWAHDLKSVGFSNDGNLAATEAVAHFRNTLDTFFAFPKSETFNKVIDIADDAITSLSNYVTLSPRADSKRKISQMESTLKEKMELWKSSHNDFVKEMSEQSDDPDRSDPNKLDPILEEISLWNSTVASSSDAKKLKSEALTYSNISEKMAIALDLECIEKPAKISILRSSVGGFAAAHEVELDKPFTKTIDTVRSDGTKVQTVWNVKKVAVKVVMPVEGTPVKSQYTPENATCARIVREMRVWSNMKHEHILPLLGIWTDVCLGKEVVKYPIAISPWMDDGHLHDYLKKHTDTTIKERISYMRDIADALAYMHNQTYPIIHGDLKSNNILMKDGKVYLCDFGLSHMLDGVSGQSSDVHCNARWAAPELLLFRNGPSTRPTCETDMYSFGSVFLEVLTGDWPYGDSISDTSVKSNRQKKVDTIPNCPSSLHEESPYWLFMKKCWRNDPLLRPTARQALLQMNKFLSES